MTTITCKDCNIPINNIRTFATEMYCHPFTDKNGKIHHYYRNKITATFTCENNHKYSNSLEPPIFRP